MRISRIIRLFDKKTFFFYCIAGGLSALVYFSLFTVFWKFFHIHYKTSVTIAYMMSILTHFTTNRRLTFKSHGKDLQKQLMRYAVMVLFNYTITMLVVHVVVSDLELSPYFGVIAAIGATVLSGYWIAKYWVFRIKMGISNI